jgi:hypothetical protein
VPFISGNGGALRGIDGRQLFFAASHAEILTVVELRQAITGEIPNNKLFYRFLTSHFFRTRYGF